VGWFTSIFRPLRSGLLILGLKAVKEVAGHPDRGIGYGMLRYLSDNTETVEQLRSLPQAEVVFNYLGQFDLSVIHLNWLKSPAGKRTACETAAASC